MIRNGAPVYTSIEDINPDKKYDVSFKTLLNSPRTLEACRRQGINPSDLDPITEEHVRKHIALREKGKRVIPQVLVDIRVKHYENKRRHTITLIKEVRVFTHVIVFRSEIS